MKTRLLLPFLLLACASPPTRLPLAVEQPAADRALYEGSGTKFLIAAQGKMAGLAAQRMYEQGGNIVDAAVAASFVISVERPHSTGLGGGGFFLFHEAKTGRTHAVDFRERAPLRASRDMYLDAEGGVAPGKSTDGILSVAVPGLVAGLCEIHAKFGRLPLARVMAPAIDLAENGLEVYPNLAGALAEKREKLARFPATRRIFLKPDGSPYRAGERLVQRELAESLRQIAERGASAFYRGPITAQILAESRRLGGLLQPKDFDLYRVKWREPVRTAFRGYELFSMPPPSSGGIHVAEILNILEHDDLRRHGVLSAESIHLTAAAMQRAFADRAEYPGDPDFVKVPVETLTGKDYAARWRATIGSRAVPSGEIRPGRGQLPESLETTHFSIMDAEGNAVASTQTINLHFGSGVTAGGILLNDEMDDFSAKPGVANAFGALGGEANAIAPRKTPLSSMSPTIVLLRGKPVMAVGAPGGTRIITCTAQTILNYLVYGLPIYEAVAVPRIHHQWQPDRIDIDAPGPGHGVVRQLRAKGYRVNVGPEAVPCRVEAVVREGDILCGAADPRDLGAVRGE